MARSTLILADLSVLAFGLLLLIGGLPAMIYLTPVMQMAGGADLVLLWQVTCLIGQAVGTCCAFVAMSTLETR